MASNAFIEWGLASLPESRNPAKTDSGPVWNTGFRSFQIKLNSGIGFQTLLNTNFQVPHLTPPQEPGGVAPWVGVADIWRYLFKEIWRPVPFLNYISRVSRNFIYYMFLFLRNLNIARVFYLWVLTQSHSLGTYAFFKIVLNEREAACQTGTESIFM